jgi:hypothetical protein
MNGNSFFYRYVSLMSVEGTAGNRTTVEMNQTQSESQPHLKTECGFGIVLGKLLKNDLANKCYCQIMYVNKIYLEVSDINLCTDT